MLYECISNRFTGRIGKFALGSIYEIIFVSFVHETKDIFILSEDITYLLRSKHISNLFRASKLMSKFVMELFGTLELY